MENEMTQVVHGRAGTLGITLSDKVARGRARRITVTITVAGAREELTT